LPRTGISRDWCARGRRRPCQQEGASIDRITRREIVRAGVLPVRFRFESRTSGTANALVSSTG
jgi:hypothetical protein